MIKTNQTNNFFFQIDKLLNARKDLFPTYEKCKVVEFG